MTGDVLRDVEIVELEELEVELGQRLAVVWLRTVRTEEDQTPRATLRRKHCRVGLLEAGEDRGADPSLEEEDHHQGQRVGAESVVAGVIDLAVPGPLLDSQHQGPHSPLQLGVAEQQVGVPHTEQQY